jgi:hypothetical protein
MNDPNSQNDEAEIRTPIEHWAKAAREQNRTEIRADHAPPHFDVRCTANAAITGLGCLHSDLGDVFLIG